MIESIIAGTISGGAISWLLKSWISERLKNSIKHEYGAKLESYKSDLKRDNDIYLLELRSQIEKSNFLIEHNLELAKLEHQIKNAGSYQDILSAIKSIHSKLIKIQQSLSSYVSIFESSEGPSKEERRKQKIKLVKEFWVEFNDNRILFNENLDKEITSYIHSVTDTGIKFMLKVEQDNENHNMVDDWTDIDKQVTELWNTVLKSIRQQFRDIIGVERK